MSEARTDKLQGIWAEDATVVSSTPPSPVTGTAYRNTSADATIGYKFLTKSASEISNQFLYTVSKLLDQIQSHGTLGWNATTTYPVGSITFGSDNQVYICILEALNKDPTTEATYWVKLDIANRAFITLSNISTVAAAADGSVKTAPDVVTSYWIASDGKSWYRKYKSGWVEQGGIVSVINGYVKVMAPVPFYNTKYSVNVEVDVGATSGAEDGKPFFSSPAYPSYAISTEYFWIAANYSGECRWEAKGLGA